MTAMAGAAQARVGHGLAVAVGDFHDDVEGFVWPIVGEIGADAEARLEAPAEVTIAPDRRLVHRVQDTRNAPSAVPIVLGTSP